MKKLQEDLSHVEYDAELLLLARREVNKITQNILFLFLAMLLLTSECSLTSLCFFCHD